MAGERRSRSLSASFARLAGSKIDAFVTAAFVGDLAQIKRDVDEILPNIDLVSALEGRTALQAAAESGHAETCEFLLRMGAKPNQQDGRNWTPLHHAASRGHLDTIRVLLENGASACARASSIGSANSVFARWLKFFADALFGPTPRHCSSDPTVRALLLRYERKQVCSKLLCCNTPLPLRNWRHELRLRADESDDQYYGCGSCVRLWWRIRRCVVSACPPSRGEGR